MNLRVIHETLVYFGEIFMKGQEMLIFLGGRFRKLSLCVYKIKKCIFKKNVVLCLILGGVLV